MALNGGGENFNISTRRSLGEKRKDEFIQEKQKTKQSKIKQTENKKKKRNALLSKFTVERDVGLNFNTTTEKY